MWLEGANDVIAQHLSISLYLTTEIARYAVFIGPVIAYIVTKRICLGLQRKDAAMLLHGYETGIIYQRPRRRVRRAARAGVGGHEGRARGQGGPLRCRWRRVRTTTAVCCPGHPGPRRQAAAGPEPRGHRERPAPGGQRPRAQRARQRARHERHGTQDGPVTPSAPPSPPGRAGRPVLGQGSPEDLGRSLRNSAVRSPGHDLVPRGPDRPAAFSSEGCRRPREVQAATGWLPCGLTRTASPVALPASSRASPGSRSSSHRPTSRRPGCPPR